MKRKKIKRGGGTIIISLSRDLKKIEEARKTIPDINVKFLYCDVSNTNDLWECFKTIEKEYNKVDVFVNNAGTIIPGGTESLSIEAWDIVLKNNLSSYFYTTKIFTPLLKKSSYPSIINISSISAKLGGSSIAYSVAKAGVDMITKITAKELAKYNIRVNAISPGMANTGIHVSNGIMSENEYKAMLKSQEANYPFGIGESIDIAEMIYYLSTKKAKWIAGENITIDGGRSINI